MDVERPPRLLPHLVLWGAGAVLAFMVLGWLVGAVFAVLRTLVLGAILLAIVWAVGSVLLGRRR